VTILKGGSLQQKLVGRFQAYCRTYSTNMASTILPGVSNAPAAQHGFLKAAISGSTDVPTAAIMLLARNILSCRLSDSPSPLLPPSTLSPKFGPYHSRKVPWCRSSNSSSRNWRHTANNALKGTLHSSRLIYCTQDTSS
jgi:hypothetical protein